MAALRGVKGRTGRLTLVGGGRPRAGSRRRRRVEAADEHAAVNGLLWNVASRSCALQRSCGSSAGCQAISPRCCWTEVVLRFPLTAPDAAERGKKEEKQPPAGNAIANKI